MSRPPKLFGGGSEPITVKFLASDARSHKLSDEVQIPSLFRTECVLPSLPPSFAGNSIPSLLAALFMRLCVNAQSSVLQSCTWSPLANTQGIAAFLSSFPEQCASRRAGTWALMSHTRSLAWGEAPRHALDPERQSA